MRIAYIRVDVHCHDKVGMRRLSCITVLLQLQKSVNVFKMMS